jgi:uncharacterized membrane protein
LKVDVQTEITIQRPSAVVAAFAAEPANAPQWYDNISSAEWKTDPPLRVGSQVAFTAHFLRRRLEYTYEIIDYLPNLRLTMRTAQGPFPMETSYTWTSSDSCSTHMTLRSHGQPTGFSKLAAPIMAKAMRRAMRKDLQKLKSILEQQP